MNRPDGQQCLAKSIIDHSWWLLNSLTWAKMDITSYWISWPRFHSGGMQQKNKRLKALLEHIFRLYIVGQLSARMPVTRRCWTRCSRIHRQCPILCLARFTEPLPDNHIHVTAQHHSWKKNYMLLTSLTQILPNKIGINQVKFWIDLDENILPGIHTVVSDNTEEICWCCVRSVWHIIPEHNGLLHTGLTVNAAIEKQ